MIPEMDNRQYAIFRLYDTCSCGDRKARTAIICGSCRDNKMKRQFCPRGHDTHIGGRDSSSKCRLCYRERKRVNRLRLYGLTTDSYNDLFNKQEGRCAVCKRHQSELPSPFQIDHDHKENRVRGLLCNICNAHVVLVIENYGHLLGGAREYLKNPPYNGSDRCPQALAKKILRDKA